MIRSCMSSQSSKLRNLLPSWNSSIILQPLALTVPINVCATSNALTPNVCTPISCLKIFGNCPPMLLLVLPTRNWCWMQHQLLYLMRHGDGNQWSLATWNLNLNNLTQGFPYLTIFTCMSPLHSHQANTTSISTNHDLQTHLNKHIWKHHHQLQLKHCHTSQLIKMTLLYLSATSCFNKPTDKLPIIGPSSKGVTIAFGQVVNTFATELQPMIQLYPDAQHMHISPAFSIVKHSLLSVGNFANNGYVGNDGATVHDGNDVTITTTKLAVL